MSVAVTVVNSNELGNVVETSNSSVGMLSETDGTSDVDPASNWIMKYAPLNAAMVPAFSTNVMDSGYNGVRRPLYDGFTVAIML